MSIFIEKSFDEQNMEWNVGIKGEVDIYTSNKLKEELSSLVEEKTANLRIEASELEYIDSTGLGILIGALKRLKQSNKDIYIVNTKTNVKKIFSITGLDKIFKLEG